VLQPLQGISEIAHRAGALLLVDAVTSLGGTDVDVDGWEMDAVYSGTQKCLSCPPGLSPVTFSDRAVEAIMARKTKVPIWYLDMTMVRKYWGSERTYHHTAPVSMIYALNQALKVVVEEGLDARFARHMLNHRALVAGVEAMGLSMLVDEGVRTPMLNAVCIPDGVDDKTVRVALLREHDIEIGGGLGPLAGKVWRIGLMGHSSTRGNVLLLLDALGSILKAEGADVGTGGVEAAEDVYARS
jgi:alanine-glyoxylate transaminase/serine-glyoxylate transaminase/serine-pyruvate transaminase